ncbi:MAG: Fic family protein [Bacilli bacterium]|nr:Fic family protein [Bacilli bacterium]
MENRYSNKYILETGIGLQDVDHLKNSSYFIQESEKYLRGEISLDELDDIVSSYYASKPSVEGRSEEADKISIRIARLISEDSFTFTVGQLLTIHKTLFDGVLEHPPGQLRTYNFSKKEWVLDGASVTYGDFRDLEMTLQYDFAAEKRFDYSRLSMDETIERLAVFIANLWQIHVFEEGNTRTTAVFAIKYFRSLGFDVTNDTFAKNAWYFRNALARANYTNIQKGIYEDRSYLIKFLRNLLLGESNPLQNKELHIVPSSPGKGDTREVRLLSLLKNNPSTKTEELAKELGVSLRTIKSVIATLVKEGKLERVGGKKYGHWGVKEG